MLESVKYHMVADVPVGAFLSAGIDSTSIVALARESGATDLQTMTLRFAEYRGRVNDEAPLAARVAQQYGVPHTIRDLTRDEFLRVGPCSARHCQSKRFFRRIEDDAFREPAHNAAGPHGDGRVEEDRTGEGDENGDGCRSPASSRAFRT